MIDGGIGKKHEGTLISPYQRLLFRTWRREQDIQIAEELKLKLKNKLGAKMKRIRIIITRIYRSKVDAVLLLDWLGSSWYLCRQCVVRLWWCIMDVPSLGFPAFRQSITLSLSLSLFPLLTSLRTSSSMRLFVSSCIILTSFSRRRVSPQILKDTRIHFKLTLTDSSFISSRLIS